MGQKHAVYCISSEIMPFGSTYNVNIHDKSPTSTVYLSPIKNHTMQIKVP